MRGVGSGCAEQIEGVWGGEGTLSTLKLWVEVGLTRPKGSLEQQTEGTRNFLVHNGLMHTTLGG